jgi:hypothetical protein
MADRWRLIYRNAPRRSNACDIEAGNREFEGHRIAADGLGQHFGNAGNAQVLAHVQRRSSQPGEELAALLGGEWSALVRNEPLPCLPGQARSNL